MPLNFAKPKDRRAWMQQLIGPMSEARWNELAWELFAWQFARVRAYQKLCIGRGIQPRTFTSWKDIPAVPQQLFKRTLIYSRALPKPSVVYETSGTTTGQPGRQHLFSADIYQAISVEGACRAGLFRLHPRLYFLTPSPLEAPHSSLSAMFGFWQKALRQSGSPFWVRKGRFEFARLRKVLEIEIKRKRPIAICGTAFSFVHLLDAWADLPPLQLPRGSWLLETGGFKGRSREISQAELYLEMSRMFSVADRAIWNEYGMSELSSQAYAHGTGGLHQTPPWARVVVCDPATGKEVATGRRGFVRWIDLANTDSVLAVQTLDLAERTTHGFRLLGRLPRSEPRGCSLGAEDLALNAGLSLAST